MNSLILLVGIKNVFILEKNIIMDKFYNQLKENNKKWVESKLDQDPEFFKKLENGNYLITATALYKNDLVLNYISLLIIHSKFNKLG